MSLAWSSIVPLLLVSIANLAPGGPDPSRPGGAPASTQSADATEVRGEVSPGADPALEDGEVTRAAPEEAGSGSVIRERGRRLHAWFFGGEVDSILVRMTPEMRARSESRGRLAAFRDQVVAELGPETGESEEEVEDRDGASRYRRTARFAGLDVPVAETWVMDREGRVAGFSIQPVAVEAPSPYLGYESRTPLRLPFRGEWTVFAGGRTLEHNHHARSSNQRFALDLAIQRGGSTHVADGKRLTDYHCWDAEVVAPAAGTVVRVVDGFPDNEIGSTDAKNVAGNHVVIDHGNGEHSFLAHFRQGSIVVEEGDRVEPGMLLGRVGNSGNTTEPHLHYHLQDGPDFPDVESMPARFHGYFRDGEWVEVGEPFQGEVLRAVD